MPPGTVCQVFAAALQFCEVEPVNVAEAASQLEALSHYRRVRDEIEAFVMTLPEMLAGYSKHIHCRRKTKPTDRTPWA